MEDLLPLLLDKKINPKLHSGKDFLPLVNNRKTRVVNHDRLVEEILISRLKAADHSAFSFIFSAYYKDLVLFASRFTHDLTNAEEIVQDTFVRLWEEHESLNITISLKSYLLKTVQNKCIDWLRHKKIMQTHSNFILESPLQFEYNTDSYVLCSELQDQIDIALSLLPETISEAFRMNRYEGLKYREIADILNVSERTIEVRIGKALHLIRNYLKKYFILIICLSGYFNLNC